MKKQYWGNGYATEVAIVLCELGIKMGKTIVARAMIENLASIRVMEKAGLKFEKNSGTRTLVVLMYYTKDY